MRFLFRLLVLALCLPLAGCQKKTDPVTAARHFFELVGAGKTDVAYESATYGFRSQRSAAVFAAAARDMGLTEYVDGTWDQPNRQGNSATIRANLKTRAGKAIPLIVTMVYERGDWRVFALRSPPSQETGLSENRFSLVGKAPTFADAVSKPMPAESEVRQMVRESLLRFNKAILSESFDEFYDAVSSHWQDQLTKGQLQRAFQPFIDRKVNISQVDKATPVFDTPSEVNSEGLLMVAGHYDTKPYKIVFSMKFYYELPNWKLFGLDVNLLE